LAKPVLTLTPGKTTNEALNEIFSYLRAANEIHYVNRENDRHTITINHSTLLRLRNKGRFGESYSEVIWRILDEAETSSNDCEIN
jgi:hypothetical protein